MIDHRVDAREFPHGSAVVMAPRHHEKQHGKQRDDDVPGVYHLIELFVSDFTAIHPLVGVFS